MAADLGDLIKRHRAQLGMTQARLAELVGMSASAVRSWERGRSVPKGESTRAALAAVLGLTDEELEAAIDGADIGFFSDPGRPVAADPTPTIVQPATDPASIPETDDPDASDEEPFQAGDRDETRRNSADLDADEPAPESHAETAGEDEPVSTTDPGAELEPETVPEPEARSDPEVEPEPESEVDPGSGSESQSAGADAARSQSAVVEAGSVPGGPTPLGAAVTRMVARQPTSTGPAAILAPPPAHEPDPVTQDAWLYRRRLIMLAVGGLVLVAVFRWALAGVGEALAEVLENLRTGV